MAAIAVDSELYVFAYGEKEAKLFKYSLETGRIIKAIPLGVNDQKESRYWVEYNDGKFYYIANGALNCIERNGKTVWKFKDKILVKYFVVNNKQYLIDWEQNCWDNHCYIYLLDPNLQPGKKEMLGGSDFYCIPDESNKANTPDNKYLVFNNVLYYN